MQSWFVHRKRVSSFSANLCAVTFFRERALACILTIYSRGSRESFPPWILIMVSFCSECKEEAGPPVKDFLSPSRFVPALFHPFARLSFPISFTHRESPSLPPSPPPPAFALCLHPSLPRIYVANKSRRIFSATPEVPTW